MEVRLDQFVDRDRLIGRPLGLHGVMPRLDLTQHFGRGFPRLLDGVRASDPAEGVAADGGAHAIFEDETLGARPSDADPESEDDRVPDEGLGVVRLQGVDQPLCQFRHWLRPQVCGLFLGPAWDPRGEISRRFREIASSDQFLLYPLQNKRMSGCLGLLRIAPDYCLGRLRIWGSGVRIAPGAPLSFQEY